MAEPGARTAWHTHPVGQTLIVTAGCGRVKRWGGLTEEIRRSEEHTSELQSQSNLVCRLLLEKKQDAESAERAATHAVRPEAGGAQWPSPPTRWPRRRRNMRLEQSVYKLPRAIQYPIAQRPC